MKVICRGHKECSRSLYLGKDSCFHPKDSCYHSVPHECYEDGCVSDYFYNNSHNCECIDYIKIERRNKLKKIGL